jgi:MFS family permease
LFADALPIYPLYALFFVDSGLSDGEVSALFAIWSLSSILAEVPFGALADRCSRRGALAAAGVLQAAGYGLWMSWPGFAPFAGGFVLWGLSGALVSGTLEALVYDGLAAVEAEDRFARALGRIKATQLLSQLPAAAAATVLFTLGGYRLAGWASVGCCLVAAAIASRLPEPPRFATVDSPPVGNESVPNRRRLAATDGRAPGAGSDSPDESEPDESERAGDDSYLATLRAGLREAAARPAVRAALTAVAVLGSLDALEEYFSLLAHDWGVAVATIPLALIAIPLVGAAGAALGGRANGVRPRTLAITLAAAALALGAAGLVRLPIGVVAVALFYGLYHLVLVVLETQLQERIEGHARATVTSVAGLGIELLTLGIYVIWVAGGAVLMAALLLIVAAALPRLVRVR